MLGFMTSVINYDAARPPSHRMQTHRADLPSHPPRTSWVPDSLYDLGVVELDAMTVVLPWTGVDKSRPESLDDD